MAPFKLKFRMGSSSRSTSQEIEEPVQQPLLIRQSAVSGGSSTTLNSDYNSMSTNNDQHTLLPNTFEEESGDVIICISQYILSAPPSHLPLSHVLSASCRFFCLFVFSFDGFYHFSFRVAIV